MKEQGQKPEEILEKIGQGCLPVSVVPEGVHDIGKAKVCGTSEISEETIGQIQKENMEIQNVVDKGTADGKQTYWIVFWKKAGNQKRGAWRRKIFLPE